MTHSLKLAVVQFTAEKLQPEKNSKRISELIDNIQADIFVLPELCLTGYYFDSNEQAMQAAELSRHLNTSFFKQIAQNKQALVIGGFMEQDGPALYNSIVMVSETDTAPSVYRKAHLFYHEHKVFTPGDTGFFSVYDEKRDIRIGLMICYDWRFPEPTRKLALEGADLIVCPSNLITSIWQQVLPARCIENKLYMAVANRCGSEEAMSETLIFTGGSAIYNFNGAELAKAKTHEDMVIVSEIFPENTRSKAISKFNDLFRDRRPDLY
jgi:predicted amidohydrolase